MQDPLVRPLVRSTLGLVVLGTALLLVVHQTRNADRPSNPKTITITHTTPASTSNLSEVVRTAMRTAHNEAYELAVRDVAAWKAGALKRVRLNYIPWAFGYWPQQKMAWSAACFSIGSTFGLCPSGKDVTRQTLLREFESRVLRPAIARKEFEALQRRLAETYLTSLQKHLKTPPTECQISSADWETYLDDIVLMTAEVERQRQVPITLKALTTGAGVFTFKALHSALASTTLRVPLARVGLARIGTLAASRSAVYATSFLGGWPGVLTCAVGVGIWEAFDHSSIKRKATPRVMEAVTAYLNQVEDELLHGASGVMAPIHDLEAQIARQL